MVSIWFGIQLPFCSNPNYLYPIWSVISWTCQMPFDFFIISSIALPSAQNPLCSPLSLPQQRSWVSPRYPLSLLSNTHSFTSIICLKYDEILLLCPLILCKWVIPGRLTALFYQAFHILYLQNVLNLPYSQHF